MAAKALKHQDCDMLVDGGKRCELREAVEEVGAKMRLLGHDPKFVVQLQSKNSHHHAIECFKCGSMALIPPERARIYDPSVHFCDAKERAKQSWAAVQGTIFTP